MAATPLPLTRLELFPTAPFRLSKSRFFKEKKKPILHEKPEEEGEKENSWCFSLVLQRKKRDLFSFP